MSDLPRGCHIIKIFHVAGVQMEFRLPRHQIMTPDSWQGLIMRTCNNPETKIRKNIM